MSDMVSQTEDGEVYIHVRGSEVKRNSTDMFKVGEWPPQGGSKHRNTPFSPGFMELTPTLSASLIDHKVRHNKIN